MSTNKHTPGPWKADSATHRGCTYIQQPNEGENGGWVVATCWGADRDANARLIASAPDLLADLEGLIGSVSHLLPYNHPALVNARAAIERATGSGFVDRRTPDELAASYPRMSVWQEGEASK